MIKAVDPNDSRAVRNVENTLACYELLINQKKPYEAAEKFLAPFISSTIRCWGTITKAWAISFKN